MMSQRIPVGDTSTDGPEQGDHPSVPQHEDASSSGDSSSDSDLSRLMSQVVSQVSATRDDLAALRAKMNRLHQRMGILEPSPKSKYVEEIQQDDTSARDDDSSEATQKTKISRYQRHVVSHEHEDHTAGVSTSSTKQQHNLPSIDTTTATCAQPEDVATSFKLNPKTSKALVIGDLKERLELETARRRSRKMSLQKPVGAGEEETTTSQSAPSSGTDDPETLSLNIKKKQPQNSILSEVSTTDSPVGIQKEALTMTPALAEGSTSKHAQPGVVRDESSQNEEDMTIDQRLDEVSVYTPDRDDHCSDDDYSAPSTNSTPTRGLKASEEEKSSILEQKTPPKPRREGVIKKLLARIPWNLIRFSIVAGYLIVCLRTIISFKKIPTRRRLFKDIPELLVAPISNETKDAPVGSHAASSVLVEDLGDDDGFMSLELDIEPLVSRSTAERDVVGNHSIEATSADFDLGEVFSKIAIPLEPGFKMKARENVTSELKSQEANSFHFVGIARHEGEIMFPDASFEYVVTNQSCDMKDKGRDSFSKDPLEPKEGGSTIAVATVASNQDDGSYIDSEEAAVARQTTEESVETRVPESSYRESLSLEQDIDNASNDEGVDLPSSLSGQTDLPTTTETAHQDLPAEETTRLYAASSKHHLSINGYTNVAFAARMTPKEHFKLSKLSDRVNSTKEKFTNKYNEIVAAISNRRDLVKGGVVSKYTKTTTNISNRVDSTKVGIQKKYTNTTEKILQKIGDSKGAIIQTVARLRSRIPNASDVLTFLRKSIYHIVVRRILIKWTVRFVRASKAVHRVLFHHQEWRDELAQKWSAEIEMVENFLLKWRIREGSKVAIEKSLSFVSIIMLTSINVLDQSFMKIGMDPLASSIVENMRNRWRIAADRAKQVLLENED